MQNKCRLQLSDRDVGLFLPALLFLYYEKENHKLDCQSLKACYNTTLNICVTAHRDIFDSNVRWSYWTLSKLIYWWFNFIDTTDLWCKVCWRLSILGLSSMYIYAVYTIPDLQHVIYEKESAEAHSLKCKNKWINFECSQNYSCFNTASFCHFLPFT